VSVNIHSANIPEMAAVSQGTTAVPSKLTFTPRQLREVILTQSIRANVGHIGSALCVAEIITALYGAILDIPHPKHQERDRFILSKGHAALALYAALHFRGLLSQEQLDTYCADASTLGVHPEISLSGIDFATGSLGQGLSFGAGAAFAARAQKSKRRVFVLISDAECNEGSTWEGIMFAAHHRLSNLVVIADINGQQAFGYTKDVCNLSPLESKLKAFNFDVHSLDGHNLPELINVLSNLNYTEGRPHILLANTVFGKGVSFMERQIKWHYNPLSAAEYKTAMTELESQ
jgi:transketolase